MEELQHPTGLMTLILFAVMGLILGNIARARGGAKLFIRRITGIDAIEEAVGRATEMGRPISFSTGLSRIEVRTLQAISVMGHVARLCAKLGTRLLGPIFNAQVLTIAEEVVREAYAKENRADAYNPNDVRFISDSQFAYAAGVVGMMIRENVAANLMFGRFQAEALIISETGQSLKALQVAGTDEPTQIPFFITACDYVIIGEEFYATSAYLTREPTALGSLVGQDWSKLIFFMLILIGMVLASIVGTKHGWFLALMGQLTGG